MLRIGYDKKILNIMKKYGADILENGNYLKEREFIQHGTTTTYTHSLCVTCISISLALKRNKPIDMRSLVRGALLHDYFLYDWHENNKYHNLHGYTHAKRSLENATADFKLNRIEREIIYCHMFPLNITRPPKSREARLVCMADKICASYETLNRLEYSPELL